MYSIWRKVVIYTFIFLGIFFIIFGVILFSDSTNQENPLEFIGTGIMLTIVALLAKRFRWMGVG